MTPITLQIKSEKFLKQFISNIPDEKELHLLMDVVKLENYPLSILSKLDGTKRYIFDYFILDTEERRDEFFDKFHELKSVFSPIGKVNKLAPTQLMYSIEKLGFNVTKKMITRFGNPIKVTIKLDNRANKKYRRYI